MRMLRWSLALAAVVAMTVPASAGAVGLGRFAAKCGYVKSEVMDPIVAPGQPTFGHMHDFFGGRQITPNSTGAQLASTAPDTTCDRLSDAAAYWTPSVFRDGVQLIPMRLDAYYRGKGPKDQAGNPIPVVENIPQAFVMIGGNLVTSPAPSPSKRVTFSCSPGIRTFARHDTFPICPADADTTLTVTFGRCWNGFNDSVNHRDHVVFDNKGKCPTSHPLPLPEIEMEIHYPTDPTQSGHLWSLSSGGMTTAHADFMNGWRNDTVSGWRGLSQLIHDCINGDRYCGLKQH